MLFLWLFVECEYGVVELVIVLCYVYGEVVLGVIEV